MPETTSVTGYRESLDSVQVHTVTGTSSSGRVCQPAQPGQFNTTNAMVFGGEKHLHQV